MKIFLGATQTYAANHSNVHFFKDDNFATIISLPSQSTLKTKPSEIDQMRILVKVQTTYCDEMLSDAELMEEIRHADLVIGEILYLCSSLVADKLSLPHVIISTSTLSNPMTITMGIPSPPSYVPQCRWSAYLTHGWNFMDRVMNVFQWMKLYLFYINDLCPMFNEIKTKHNITPNKNIQETLGRVDLIIGQMPFMLDHPRPLFPSKYIWASTD